MQPNQSQSPSGVRDGSLDELLGPVGRPGPATPEPAEAAAKAAQDDAEVGAQGQAEEGESAGRSGKKAKRTRRRYHERPAATSRIRASFYISEDLLEECRDTAVFLAGYPARLTLASLAETALRNEIARLKKKYNEGKDFPRRPEDLRGGRPIGS